MARKSCTNDVAFHFFQTSFNSFCSEISSGLVEIGAATASTFPQFLDRYDHALYHLETDFLNAQIQRYVESNGHSLPCVRDAGRR